MNNNKRRKKQYSTLKQALIILCFAAAALLTLTINLFWKSDTSDKAYTAAYSDNGNSTETDNRVILEDQIVPASSQNNNSELSQEATEIYKRNKSLLILVNTENPLSDSYEFSKHTLNSGLVIDEQAYIDFYRFTKACNDAGFHYNIISAYRDRETQQGIINRNINEFMQSGLSEAEAREKTYETVQHVGCSEHETGLSIYLSAEKIFSLTEDLE
ncbi:MAG: D-alanyl-D-alanine carboxypeptidase family protein, partial [Lachnospiraceae bacterium]|nr:D-alanyl-D-alanine carboxypeptidase family protein [Lachnospiraceae bacterium]